MSTAGCQQRKWRHEQQGDARAYDPPHVASSQREVSKLGMQPAAEKVHGTTVPVIGRVVDELVVRTEVDALDAARTLATESEKREDSRVALEFGSLATGQGLRALAVQRDLQTLVQFYEKGIPTYGQSSAIGLGAIVDVCCADSTGGDDERTYILLPVGAGTELTGPGGDGFLTVITPASPVGKALMGQRAGDIIDVTVRGEPLEWQVVGVS